MSLAGDVDLESLAAETDDTTGAGLKIIVTEAGMNAIRNKRQEVSMADFRYALDKLAKEEKNEPYGMFV
jgi:proteasome regulatory subunit